MDEKNPRKLHVTIGEDEEHPLLDLVSWLPSHAVYQLMEQFGLPLQVFEPPRAVARSSLVPRVSCKHRQECIDSSDKCGECAYNEAKSWFKQRT